MWPFKKKKDIVESCRERLQSEYENKKRHQVWRVSWHSLCVSADGSAVISPHDNPHPNMPIHLSPEAWTWVQFAIGDTGKWSKEEIPLAVVDVFCVSLFLVSPFSGIIPVQPTRYEYDDAKLRNLVQGETSLTENQKTAIKRWFESSGPPWHFYWERRPKKVRKILG